MKWRLGGLAPDDAADHPRRNVLTRALGIERQIKVDVSRHPITGTQSIVLASDGAARYLGQDDIASIFETAQDVDLADALVRLAQQRGGSDSASAVVVRADGVSIENETTGERLAIFRARVARLVHHSIWM